MKTKIFITGGRGFVGSHLLPLFNENEFELICLSRSVTVQSKNNVTWILGELETIEQHRNVINECDYVVHLAGEIGHKLKMKKTNEEGIQKLLSVIRPHKTNGFIYLSSAGIYNIYKQTENVIDENTQCYPSNEYEKTKTEAEKILQSIVRKNNLRFVILRPTNVIGENDPRKKLLNLCKSLLSGRFLFLKREAVVNYVYAGDVAKVIFKIIRTNDFTNEVYNLNSPMKMNEFIETLKQELKFSGHTKFLPALFRPAIYFASHIGNMLPKKFRYFDLIKYNELTNTKMISNAKVQKHFEGFSSEDLKAGLKKMVYQYRIQKEI